MYTTKRYRIPYSAQSLNVPEVGSVVGFMIAHRS